MLAGVWLLATPAQAQSEATNPAPSAGLPGLFAPPPREVGAPMSLAPPDGGIAAALPPAFGKGKVVNVPLPVPRPDDLGGDAAAAAAAPAEPEQDSEAEEIAAALASEAEPGALLPPAVFTLRGQAAAVQPPRSAPEPPQAAAGALPAPGPARNAGLPPGYRPQVAALPGAASAPPGIPAPPPRPGVAVPDARPAELLRDTDVPAAGLPGVYTAPSAVYGCLPQSLKQVLVDVAERFGAVAILNARRPSGTGARGSYHYQCRAVDFRVRGVPHRDVLAYLRAHPHVGGRKLYPFGFFHIDDGPVRGW